jgi:hypothetical protein
MDPKTNKTGGPQDHRDSGGRSHEGPTTDDELIDEMSKESFPTSDPPSYSPRKPHQPPRRTADDDE